MNMKQTEALKLALEWIGDAVVVLSHTSTAIQGGIGADAEGVGGCSVGVVAAIREALAEPPAQRTWVGLTDEEWQDLSDRYGLIIWGPFKREIEAKLKEKNA